MLLTLLDLSDDVLVQIVRNVNLEALFALRLTCKSVHTLIHYPRYIVTIMKAVASNTFPPETLFNPDGEEVDAENAFEWLKGLIPLRLAIIALDKLKLFNTMDAMITGFADGTLEPLSHPRKFSKFAFMFPGIVHGIPAEINHTTANIWRHRVANGWRVLQRLALVSNDAYGYKGDHDPDREPHASSLERDYEEEPERQWTSEDEYRERHFPDEIPNLALLFGEAGSYESESEDCPPADQNYTKYIACKEEEILERRLELISELPVDYLRDYLLLWVILRRCFVRGRSLDWLLFVQSHRREPEPGERRTEYSSLDFGVRRPMMSLGTQIDEIGTGCSWLEWFVLHHGVGMFWTQWWGEESRILDPHNTDSYVQTGRDKDDLREFRTYTLWQSNHISNLIEDAYAARDIYQLELERAHVAQLEFMIRKRCLQPEARAQFEQASMPTTRTDRFISLSAIPYIYDDAPAIFPDMEPSQMTFDTFEDFPFGIYDLIRGLPYYQGRKWIWLHDQAWVRIDGEDSKIALEWNLKADRNVPDLVARYQKGPLRRVPYMIHLH